MGRLSEAAPTGRPIDWRKIASERNANLARRDVEWAISTKGDGIYLRPVTDRDWREWKPEPGEIEATNQVAARAVASGLPPEEWTRLVKSGAITREVLKTMRENIERQNHEEARNQG